MRILAFSDLHGDAAAARAVVRWSSDADVVVGAGDFGSRGDGASEVLGILGAIAAPWVVVHGNHDDPSNLAAICAGRSTVHYLHGDAVTLSGVRFFGLGGEIPPRGTDAWNASETEADAETLLDRCPGGAVLVTHSPPLGVADLQEDGRHEGSAAIRRAIRSRRPALHLCGHIHAAWGTGGRIGDTPVHNLGPEIAWFELP